MYKIWFLLSFIGRSLSVDDLHNPIVFYDLKTKEPFQPPIIKVLPGSEKESFNMSSYVNIRLPFIGQPCKLEANRKLIIYVKTQKL